MGSTNSAHTNPAKGSGTHHHIPNTHHTVPGTHHPVPSTHMCRQGAQKGYEDPLARIPAADSRGGFPEPEPAAVVLPDTDKPACHK